MSPSGWILLALGCTAEGLFSNAGSADYFVTVLQELARTETGVPSFVFYGEPSVEGTDWDGVLADARLELATKIVLRKAGGVEVGGLWEPTAVVVLGGLSFGMSASWSFFMMRFRPGTRVVVSFGTQERFYESERLMKYLVFYNVIYVSEVNMDVIIGGMLRNVPLSYHPKTSVLLRSDLRRSFSGKPIKYVSRGNSEWGSPQMTKWIEAMASFMNTSAVLMPHSCDSKINWKSDKCFVDHFYKTKSDINFSLTIMKGSNSKLFEYFYTNMLTDLVLLVPRFPLSILQMFLIPFSWQVWITLGVIFTLVEAIHLAIPNAFRNDPVLTVICGYERFDLHKATRREKLVIFSLIVLTFFAINSYETKIVSMMISKPITKEIKTFEDLLNTNVKIKGDRKINSIIDQNSSLAQLTIADPDMPPDIALQMDLRSAYLYDRDLTWQILPLYYDPTNRFHRYNVMSQSLSQYPKILLTRPRTPLMDAFSYTLDCFIEAGLHDYWAKTVSQFRWTLKVRPLNHLSPDVLTFADFRPAWLPLLLGTLASSLVFSAEVILHQIAKRWTGTLKRMRARAKKQSNL